MARMLRNLVGVKPNAGTDDLKRYVSSTDCCSTILLLIVTCYQLVQSIIDQCHLSPLGPHIQPTLCEYDHSLRLYPIPTTVMLLCLYSGNESYIHALSSWFWQINMNVMN